MSDGAAYAALSTKEHITDLYVAFSHLRDARIAGDVAEVYRLTAHAVSMSAMLSMYATEHSRLKPSTRRIHKLGYAWFLLWTEAGFDEESEGAMSDDMPDWDSLLISLGKLAVPRNEQLAA